MFIYYSNCQEANLTTDQALILRLRYDDIDDVLFSYQENVFSEGFSICHPLYLYNRLTEKGTFSSVNNVATFYVGLFAQLCSLATYLG